jgi:hypothetical protein
MTSLGYSDWNTNTNNNTNNNNTSSLQKRIPTIGKGTGMPMNNNDTTMMLVPPILEEQERGGRAAVDPDKINALLDKMNMEEQHQQQQRFSSFDPIAPPVNIVKMDKSTSMPLAPTHPQYGGRAAVYADMANYQTAYGQVSYRGQPQESIDGSSVHLDKTLEKLNYLIHLLEQQQKEKTGGILEEFLLYCLFGVFVIFVVDAFARFGKNVGTTTARLRYKR